MAISNERLSDRVEFLRAFLQLKHAIDEIADKSKLLDDVDVKNSTKNLNDLFDTMLDRLEKDQNA